MPTKSAANRRRDAALDALLDTILACPVCHGRPQLQASGTVIRCDSCLRSYPVEQGIPVLLTEETVSQEEERRFRDSFAAGYYQSNAETLMDLIGQHHCIPIMRDRAEKFRALFQPHEWILDIGTGNAWHWSRSIEGAKVIGLDMSLGNLVLAQRLLGTTRQDVVLVCADARALPIRDRTISGIWDVQVFQHFPQEVLRSVQAEANRVLRDEFLIEMHNLNPAVFHRLIYRIFGKRFHCRGRLGPKELNRLSAREWAHIWQQFRQGHPDIRHGYSELFFHPDFGLRPRHYPMKLERALVRHAPKFAALFARQVQVTIEARARG